MDKHTTTTTRDDIALVRFGGRTWQLLGVEYSTAILHDKYADIRVHYDRIEVVNEKAADMMRKLGSYE